MPTPEKQLIIDEMAEKFKRATGVFLVDFTGMDVNTTTDLRKNFKEQNVEYRIVKNTLAKISLEKAGFDGLQEYMTGVTAYAITYDDPTIPVKLLDKKKEFKDKLKVKAALFEGKVLTTEQAKAVVDLPSRDELLSKLVGTLQAPMTNFARVINAVGSNLVTVLKALEETKK